MPDQKRALEQRGFSLVEILIVVAIAMIVIAMSGLMMMNVRNQYRLRISTVDLSTLLQRARMQAVRDNRTYRVLIDIPTQRVFLDSNNDGLWTQGEPAVQMQPGVTVRLDTSGAGNPTVPNASLGFIPPGSSADVGFTGRGMPCYFNGGGVCTNWAGPNPVGFVYYTQSTLGSGTNLAAISIAPSGRFRVWTYNPHTSTWGQ